MVIQDINNLQYISDSASGYEQQVGRGGRKATSRSSTMSRKGQAIPPQLLMRPLKHYVEPGGKHMNRKVNEIINSKLGQN